MESDEIRAEIERRKIRAKDLKIREILWSIYDNYLSHYETIMETEPERICPEIREAIKFLGHTVEFKIGQIAYKLIYKEGPSSEEDYEDQREKTVPATLALRMNEQKVFKFQITKSTLYSRSGPIWKDYLGEITHYIDGPWVTEIAALLGRTRSHEKAVRDLRDAPKLNELKKRFGI